MRIVCVPEDYDTVATPPCDLNVVLYGRTNKWNMGSIGATIWDIIQQCQLQPEARAWDLLSIALSIIAADTAIQRNKSPDGWTRQLDLHVAVSDPAFWKSQTDLLIKQLKFLTTDIWSITFLAGGVHPVPPKSISKPDQDCVVLLSGGLDSLIGTINLMNADRKVPYAVSQISRGDKHTQTFFASMIGGGLKHLQLNHNFRSPGQNELSQRARSFIFFAYGVLAATALARYHDGEDVTLYVCENGFISLNPPLTGARLGSLSTRTTHPVFIDLFQQLLNVAGLRVKLENPYQFQTKGEMLQNCVDQVFLQEHAHTSTSCGRYARRYKHCGRCLPCLIRRSAFYKWGFTDQTEYVYSDLSLDHPNYARYDDVRSATMAVVTAETDGIAQWAASSLSTALLDNVSTYQDVIGRGLQELGSFLKASRVL